MNTSIIVTLAAVAATILAGSDILRAELFTDYEVGPLIVQPGHETMLHVKNIGSLQADNAVVLIAANGTISGFTDVCAEGQASRLDDRTLVVKFPRMSPQMGCGFGLTASEPVHLNATISSDGRVTLWDGSPSTSIAAVIIFLVLAAEVGFSIFFHKKLFGSERWNMLLFKLQKKKFTKSKMANKICTFVMTEYALKINEIDGTVLELIYCRKTTMGQLKSHSGLTIHQIKYRIKKLRSYELIHDDKVELNLALANFLKTGCTLPAHD